ncbi:glycoside hydrolase family 27 protein [Aestuariibaculum suncheonense]|uniref:Alpha-galactosidase n=1 Tax=Aestuariibaculum suncheonense TaxID=1028745 RepID=A0A8J6QR20_9FLAO|nr:glycoside hydrolase family 27 protein [Aestuariibaculum suncheonense]MBD0834759.1 glycoside hydrolase family 27 protein [Aestuariibaculum suncheonense]
MKKAILNLVVVLFSLSHFAQKFENLAKTPPMGWNSWNKYGCDVDEKLIMKMADEIVNSGMQEVGYEYVVIDDCWQVGRSEDGEIIVDKERFPSGMKKLADYIHSKGLKFGIYSCAGTETCQERPGSRGYEFQDARTYARWEVDFLKHDWCNTSTQNAQASYSIMRDALFAAGRPIVFSICEWGKSEPWEWGKDVGHLWRTTGDIRDSWESMISIVDKEKDLFKFAEPGSWNDPDMLEVGNGGMTTEEYKTHFSLWCMLAAPLMAGNDLSDMTKETKEILMNRDLIAINQDVLGKQGFVYRDNGDYQIWIKQLDNKEKAVCLLNRSDEVKKVQVDFNLLLKANSSIGWRTYIDPYELKDYSVRDLWEHKSVNIGDGTIFLTIPPHAVKVFKFVRN